MAVRLRLQRGGAKKRPFYRIVATDGRNPRDGRFIEMLGTFDPLQEPPIIRLNGERVKHWISVGAKPSETVSALIKKLEAGEGIDLGQEGADKAARAAASQARETAKNAAKTAAAAASKEAEAAKAAEAAEAKAAEEAAAAEAKAAEEAAAAEAKAAEEAAAAEAAPAEEAAPEAAAEEAAPAEEAAADDAKE